MTSSVLQAFNIALAKALVEKKLLDKKVLRQKFIKERMTSCKPRAEHLDAEFEILTFLGIDVH